MEYLSALAQPQTAWLLPSSALQAQCEALPSRGPMHLKHLHYRRMLGQGHTGRPTLGISGLKLVQGADCSLPRLPNAAQHAWHEG